MSAITVGAGSVGMVIGHQRLDPRLRLIYYVGGGLTEAKQMWVFKWLSPLTLMIMTLL